MKDQAVRTFNIPVVIFERSVNVEVSKRRIGIGYLRFCPELRKCHQAAQNNFGLFYG